MGALIGFRLALDWAYVAVIATEFAPEGYQLEFGGGRFALSWLLTLVLAWRAPAEARRPSDVLLTLLLLTPLLPMLTLLAWRGDSPWFALLAAGSGLAILAIREVRWPGLPRIERGPQVAVALAAAGIVLTFAVMIARGGLSFINLNVAAVYLFRDAATERSASGLFAYVVDWSIKVLIPAIAAYYLLIGRSRLAVLALLLEVPLFALTSQKAPLAFVGLLGLVLACSRARNPTTAITLSLAGAIVGSVIAFEVWGWLIPASLGTRRVFFVPAHLNFAYFEYFRDAGHVWFATVLPDWIVPYRFAFPTAQLVGDYLAPGSGLWANTGYVGAGFMQLGAIGVAFYAIVLGALLGLADTFGKEGALWPVTVITIIPFLTAFTSSDLPTSILTHGIGPCLLLAALLRPGDVRA
jgi:hypothetical protein